MKFFIDTANVEDIRKANDMGIICGVTTNPSLIAKEGRDFNQVCLLYTSNKPAEKDGIISFAVEPFHGMRDILFFKVKQLSKSALYNCFKFENRNKTSNLIKHNCAKDTAKCRKKNNPN